MKDDVIYRQAAIDAKQEFRNPNVMRSTEARTAYDRTYANGWNDCNSAWIDVVKDLPSAQTEHNSDDERKIADLHKMVNYLLSRLESQWIPVSEGLPKEYGEYICTMENGQVQECGFVPENQRGLVDGWSTCEADGHKFLGYADVLAWMPLPDPWKEGEA